MQPLKLPNSQFFLLSYYILTDLAEKAGLRQRVRLTEGMKPGRIRHKVKAVHGLRKFWDTQMTLAGVSPLWTELLEGHKIKGMKHHYLRPSDEELLEGSNDAKFLGYAAAIDRLTINDDVRLRKQVRVLEKEKDGWEKAYHEAMSMKDDLKKKGLL